MTDAQVGPRENGPETERDLHARITEAIRRGAREGRRPEVIAHAVLNIVDPVDDREATHPADEHYHRLEATDDL